MKNVYSILLLHALVFLPAMCLAQTGNVSGVVRSSTGPVAGAAVNAGTGETMITDTSGKFFINDLKAGPNHIRVQRLGYTPFDGVVLIEEGMTVDWSCLLQSGAAEMDSVSVSAGRYLHVTSNMHPDLQIRPVDNTQELLRLVPGLFIAQHQGGGKAEQIFLRGFDCDHGTDVNISVDNMPVNMVSHAHGQGFADAHFIIPETVQTLDYGKGPYNADKGNLATAGYVAFKTRNSLDNSFVKTEGGMYNYYRSVAGIDLLNHKQGDGRKADAYLVGEYAYNGGYFELPQRLNRFSVFGKYTGYLSPGKIVSLSLSGFGNRWDASGQLPTRAVDANLVSRYGTLDPEAGNTGRYNANLSIFSSLNDHSYFKSNVYATYYYFDLFSNFTFFLDDTVNGDQIRQAEKRGVMGCNNEYNTTYTLANLKMKTAVGQAVRYDRILGNELSHTVAKSRLLNRVEYGDIYEANLSGYLSQTVFLSHRLEAYGILRYDHFFQQYVDRIPADVERSSLDGGVWSPKAGIDFKVSNNVRLYYKYGTGFHSNDARTVALGRQFGNSIDIGRFIPRAFSSDLGAVVRPSPRLQIAPALWVMKMEQEFSYVGDAAVIDTSGNTRRYGADFTARYDVAKWLSFDFDINYAVARFIDKPAGFNFVALAPILTSVGGVTARATRSLYLSLRYRHLADRPADGDNTLVAHGYSVFDGVVSYSRSRYEFTLQAQNLLNTQWKEAQFATETRIRNKQGVLEPVSATDVCYTPGTPFALKLGATIRF